MVDGVAGADLLSVLLDRQRTPRAPARDTWTPQPSPEGAELVVRAVAMGLQHPFDAVRELPAPAELLRTGRRAAGGLLSFGRAMRAPAPSSLNGPVGPHRRWSWARAQLSDIKAVRAEFGGTVNDVVLACIAGGFRELLISRGEAVDRVVRTLVPVSVRSPGEYGIYNNRVSAMFADLPVAIADPLERLAAVSAQMTELKDSHEAVAGEVLTSLTWFAPPLLLALAERLATRLPQHSVNTVTTNVPGPQEPLYAGGRRMLESIPYVPLGGHVRIGVAIFSYDGACSFGVTGDYDAAPDIDVLCESIEHNLAELVRLARPARRRSRAGDRSRAGSPRAVA
jgi:diacylglycerol O-acyltransferase